MLDKILTFGAGFDWIGPLVTFIQDYRRRPAVRYNVPADCGWHAYAIRNLLQEAGISVWGLALYHDVFVFSVRLAQARYTQYLLERAGIPYHGGVEGDMIQVNNARLSKEPERIQQTGLNGWVEQINRFVDSI